MDPSLQKAIAGFSGMKPAQINKIPEKELKSKVQKLQPELIQK